mmetsp:Transcript_49066/g.141049  ORF Transcript_49066/g.141049 Transcript_49066/m.141049 type:complete len:241 (-) Transcript_49066:79-801(-)
MYSSRCSCSSRCTSGPRPGSRSRSRWLRRQRLGTDEGVPVVYLRRWRANAPRTPRFSAMGSALGPPAPLRPRSPRRRRLRPPSGPHARASRRGSRGRPAPASSFTRPAAPSLSVARTSPALAAAAPRKRPRRRAATSLRVPPTVMGTPKETQCPLAPSWRRGRRSRSRSSSWSRCIMATRTTTPTPSGEPSRSSRAWSRPSRGIASGSTRSGARCWRSTWTRPVGSTQRRRRRAWEATGR